MYGANGATAGLLTFTHSSKIRDWMQQNVSSLSFDNNSRIFQFFLYLELFIVYSLPMNELPFIPRIFELIVGT